MRKAITKLLLFVALMVCSFTAVAADWPATLYMLQTSFSSTGRVSATGSGGVYEFTLTYPQSNTTAPRYYVFSSATTAANAKKDGYVTFGASPVQDGLNVQPVDGTSYTLHDLSGAENVGTLANQHICAFLPVYSYGATFNVTVDLNDMSVVFRRNPADETPLTLGVFNKATSKALMLADVVDDGKAYFSLKLQDEKNVYFAANATTRAETNVKPIWGSSSQVSPANIVIDKGNEYPLARTTYYQVYSAANCGYTLPAGAYDIIVDLNAGKVEFKDYTGAYRSKPDKLYMRSNTYTTKYGEAQNENGVYRFTFDKSANYTTEPYCIVFTEASSLSTARDAYWVLGAGAESGDVVPEFGKAYPLVDVDADAVYNKQAGSFMPLYPQNYDVVVDLNVMTVTFTPKTAPEEITQLNMMTDGFKLAGTSELGDDGKFHFSYRGTPGLKMFLTTATDRSSMQKVAASNFGAGGHANPQILSLDYNNSYTAERITYRRIVTDATGFFVLPGKCDITFDPVTRKLDVMPYTGNYDVYPEVLSLRSSAFSTKYADATGENGVYVFEYTTQGYNSSPRKLIFTDATSYSRVTPVSWVLGASEDGSTVQPYPGMVTPLFDVVASDVYSYGKSVFVPFHPYTYTITVDLKNRTVTWGEAIQNPGTMYLMDDNYGKVAAASGNADGVYQFEGISYSSHPMFISDAENSTALRSTPWIYLSTPYSNPENVNVSDGMETSAWRGTYYQYNYEYSFWVTPEGCNKIKASLDTKNNTIAWNFVPVVPRPAEVLYMVDSEMNIISKVVSDGTGIFDFEVDLPYSASLAFTDEISDNGGIDPMFYGSSVPYTASEIRPVFGDEYDVFITAPDVIRSEDATWYLQRGKYRVHVDMNTRKVVFDDITAGGVWYVPETLAICDDNLKVIATGTLTGEGVFTFTDVKIAGEGASVNTVFLDTAEGGSIFGSNVTGELGPMVESGESYDLYMPKELWVTTDGASCFGLAPSTYNITVDFSNRTVRFVDPSIPVYPDKMQIVVPGDEAQVLSEVSGSKQGLYVFKLRNSGSVSVVFSEPASGGLYGANGSAPTVESGLTMEIAKSGEKAPVQFVIPEGVWTVELNLAAMTAHFTQTVLPEFISTTMPEGTAFPSYFGVGTNPKAVFKFNNDLSEIKGVWVVIGDYAGGVPVEGEKTVFGKRAASLVENTLVMDFTGQHYELPEGAEPKVHIVLSTVKDANGELLVSEAVEGLPAGSMVFEYPFSEFERMGIDAVFSLPSGSNIDEVATLEMKVNHFDHIKFSNIVFAEVNDSESESEETAGADGNENVELIPARWERGETDADGYTLVKIAVPMKVRGKGELKLYLEGLDIDDGYNDHADDVTVNYVSNTDPTVLVEATPADGSTVGDIDAVTLKWTHPIITSVGNKAPCAYFENRSTGNKIEAAYSYPGDERSLVVTPGDVIMDAGVYTLCIGEGDLVFNDDYEAANRPVELSFTIDPSLGISLLSIDDNDDVEVVDVNGIVVRRGKGLSTLRGLKGIFIVNGVKRML